MKRTTNPDRQTRQRGLLVLLLTLLALTASAAPVTPERAARVAEGFWRETPQCGEFKAIADVSQRLGFATFYTFEVNGGEGFVLVAADDRVRPVLGYGLGSVPEGTLRRNVGGWLRWYESQLAALEKGNCEARGDWSYEWQRLESGASRPRGAKSVPVLLTTQWDQSPLYNDQCPYDSEAGDHAVTGCSATATTQVMKYWNHPTRGQGSHRYLEDDFGWQEVDFGATTYNWGIMPDQLTFSSSAEEIAAVAQLMYHVGVAIEMDYSVEGSGAYTISYGGWTNACTEVALPTYFDYKPTLQGYTRDYIDYDTWQAMITEELDNARPVLYTGADTSGGHAFVCDGYDDNGYFHMNWGWSGALDGYFQLDSLVLGWGGTGSNSSFTFNYDQTILVGIEPNSGALRVNRTRIGPLSAENHEERFVVRSNETVADGWTATTTADWLSVSPSGGEGNGSVSEVTLTVMPNEGDETRSGEVVVTQGNEEVRIAVTQRGTLNTLDGWVGTDELMWPYNIEAGREIILCSERFGNYRSGDRVTKVSFTTAYEDEQPDYNNNRFKIKIYEVGQSHADVNDIQNDLYAWYAEEYTGQPVYEQDYTQAEPGPQVVNLNEPYVIGTSMFWIGLECEGKTLMMFKYADECPERLPGDEAPNKDCAVANYRYASIDTAYGYSYIELSYILFCDNEACDTVVQGNVDFTFSFYVDNTPVGIELATTLPQLRVYPNPARDELKVEGCEVLQVELVDMLGRSLRRWHGGDRMTVTGLPAGVYMLRVTTDDGTATRRVMVER